MFLSTLSIVISLAWHIVCLPQVPQDQVEKKCKDYSDFGYFCVPYYQCDASNQIITDGVGLVDPRQVDDECIAGIQETSEQLNYFVNTVVNFKIHNNRNKPIVSIAKVFGLD